MLKTRRSVRKYSDQPVTREVLDAIFDAVTYAPSWKNTQSVRYTVVESAELKARIADEAVLGFALNQKTISRCPVLLIQSTVNSISGHSPDGSVDTSKGDTWASMTPASPHRPCAWQPRTWVWAPSSWASLTRTSWQSSSPARRSDRHRYDRHRLSRRGQQNAAAEACF